MNSVMCVVDDAMRCARIRALIIAGRARVGSRRTRSMERDEWMERDRRRRCVIDSYRVLTGNVCVVPRVVGVERLRLQDHGR